MKRYRSPEAFRQALEERLKALDNNATPLAQKRQFLALQRFLVRVRECRPTTILKGGLGLRLRYPRARATRDLDLLLTGERESDGALLGASGLADLEDFFSFIVQFRERVAGTTGNRFHCTCSIGGRLFAEFGIDAVAETPFVGEVTAVPGSDWLSFAEIPRPTFDVYPLATQIAEKLHALTQPRSRPNTRDRDLPDLALLARMSDGIAAPLVRSAVDLTFQHRSSHDVPTELGDVPADWAARYVRLAQEHALEWRTFEEAITAARLFIDPLLNGSAVGAWSAERSRWE